LVDLGELVDVGARDEAGLLARANDETAWLVGREPVDDRRQLRHHVLRERVGRCTGLVEGQPGDAVGVLVEAKVAVLAECPLVQNRVCRFHR
jgi:hypothetical protein